MLLDHLVAGAGRRVVPVGPDRRTRIVRKQRTEEFVPIVRTERIRPRADRVAHRIRTLRRRLARRGAPPRGCCWRHLTWWLEEARGTRLIRDAWRGWRLRSRSPSTPVA